MFPRTQGTAPLPTRYRFSRTRTPGPLYHIYDDNRPGMCTVCGTHVGNIAVHVHEAHNPAGPCYEQRRGVGAAVVVHCLRTNRFLMVSVY